MCKKLSPALSVSLLLLSIVLRITAATLLKQNIQPQIVNFFSYTYTLSYFIKLPCISFLFYNRFQLNITNSVLTSHFLLNFKGSEATYTQN